MIDKRDPLKNLTTRIDSLIEEFEEVNSLAAKMTIALSIVDNITALNGNIFNGKPYVEYLSKEEQTRYKNLMDKYNQEYEVLRQKDLKTIIGEK